MGICWMGFVECKHNVIRNSVACYEISYVGKPGRDINDFKRGLHWMVGFNNTLYSHTTQDYRQIKRYC
jgi:hypothetical protein